MEKCTSKYYKELKFSACLTARHLSRIFAKVLLALIDRLVADEAGKTCLGKRQHMSLGKMVRSKKNTDSTTSAAHRAP